MNFDEAFQSLTDFSPMRWQRRLFERFVEGDLPEVCDIPTGLGKTSVIVIWLLALAHPADRGRVRLPRRLVYVVNRRTVVDQATHTVERIRHRLMHPDTPEWQKHTESLRGVASALRGLCASEANLLGVSTLRGELADNEEWKTDPARPAIVIGTIDMIGSKLLFSGYGDGRYWRAQHAGLIGQDALILHDEAHLTPAFSELLRGVRSEQGRSREPRPVRVMELSATQRIGGGDAFQLESEDETDELIGKIVKERLDAKKRLELHGLDNSDAVEGLVELTKRHAERPSKVLIYVRSPEDAQRVADLIRKDVAGFDGGVALLTGTIRGHERDRLVAEDPVFHALLDQDSAVAHPVLLISTSAGEVGIDIDADHMVCDLTTLDSMVQRLGRVNRRGGEGREARVDVVWTKEDVDGGDKPLRKAIAKTFEVLRSWVEEHAEADGLLVSPRIVRALVDGLNEQDLKAAFSPEPTIAPLTEILLDSWSLTSIESMPGRPDVAGYLHGLTTDPPETFVAWRKEVPLLADLEPSREGLSQEAVKKAQREFEASLSDWFGACRIETRERLRDTTERVRTKLNALLGAHRKTNPDADFPVVVLDSQGHAEWSALSEIVRKPDRNASDPIRYRTVVLPNDVGGLDSHGMLVAAIEPGKGARSHGELDVAEAGGQRARAILHQAGTEFSLQDIGTPQVKPTEPHGQNQDGEDDGADRREFASPQDAAVAFARERDLVLGRLIALKESGEEEEGEGKARYLLLMVPSKASALDDPERAPFEQTLDNHTRLIGYHADRIADALNLADELRDALVRSGRWHDCGKDRPVWQRFARNDNGATPLAKSMKYLHWRALAGYRHEFGSLLEAMADKELGGHAERDLILHMIAAHHGWARPYFEPRSFDHQGRLDPSTGDRRQPTSSDNEAAAIEAMQRFGKLQQRFGRWGLAWLESILRCADIAASKPPTVSQGAGSGGPEPQEGGA